MTAVQFKHALHNDVAATLRMQQAGKTYFPVLKATRSIQSKANRELALYVLQAAVDNADDTCILEKAQPLTEWDTMFRGSVESLLACSTWGCKFHGTVGEMRVTRNHLNTFFARHGLVG